MVLASYYLIAIGATTISILPLAISNSHQHNHQHLTKHKARELRHDPFRKLNKPPHMVHAHGKVYENLSIWTRSAEFKEYGDACGTRDPTITEKQRSDEIVSRWVSDHDCERSGAANPLCRESQTGRRKLQNVEPIEIETYFHVIRTSGGVGLAQQDVTSSMNVLNAAYDPDFTFVLKETTYTNNDQFYQTDYYSDNPMKEALRKGDCSTLNIYAKEIGGGILGYATLPNGCAGGQTRDGVVILDDTVPGGAAAPYNGGDTLVHEVGHWLGLDHTFDGGCSGGDSVSDTQAEASPSYECDLERDTCPNKAGKDPVTNYMDYSPDACMDNFTAGQRTRMKAEWAEYRGTQSEWDLLFFNNFENPGKWGDFSKGGKHASWHGKGAHSFSGKGSLVIRNGKGKNSAIISKSFDASKFSEIKVDFMFKAVGTENGEGFGLEYSVGGNNYITKKIWKKGTDFRNGKYYAIVEHISVDSRYNDMHIRFIAMGNEKNDRIFIDDVSVLGI